MIVVVAGAGAGVDSELKRNGRGSFDDIAASIYNVDIRVVKWYDNRVVILYSTCAGTQPIATVKRYDRSKKEIVTVPCSSMVKILNQNISGEDLLDALIAYFRINIKLTNTITAFSFI